MGNIFVNARAAQIVVDDQQTQKYLTLLEISKAITSHQELSELFHDLACRLQNLFPFRDLAVMLHDERRNVMRSYTMEGCDAEEWIGREPTEVSVEDSINGHVWKTQTPIIIEDLNKDFRFPAARIIRDKGIRSVCCLPLSTAYQNLGALNLWSDEPGAYRDFDIDFAQLVAGQIAVAVEAQFQREQIARERDRSQLLLQVNNTLVSNLNLRELLSAISSALSPVMPHEAAALTLYDEASNELRVAAFDFPEHDSKCVTGKVVPFEGNPIGEAFTTRKTVVIDYAASDDPQVACSGFLSGCASPLISRDRVLGVLAIKSRRQHAFSSDESELLGQVAQQVAIAVENALAYNEIETLKNKLEKEKLYLEEEIRTEYNFEEIIGSSSVLRRVLQNVETVATTDSTVLIYGETGTGKELIARAIHNLSDRRERTLVKVNCAAIPTGLLESELFGHEKGAFTGAIDRRIGRFELAHQGTIFLDEVEDIPPELQSKLLRVLQEHEFERLGSSRTLRVDVRVVAATNADLEQMVQEKKFRSDLYYRLNVFPISVPPLRERPEDIPLLVHFFANKFAQQMKRNIESVPKETMAALLNYHWPGNIRELQNLIERGVILSRGSTLEIPLGELKQATKSADHANGSITLESVEREHILRVLNESKWVIGGPGGAAARLGVNRTTLNHRLRKLGITRPQPQF
ncbi:MAG TPA: sigma 54-interacting transcriptional regulator [Pyrinomonadaceae bacterium]|nr:sigma 54-interacting transcriptional regulator [Pyrinomonadaceae bacterium]